MTLFTHSVAKRVNLFIGAHVSRCIKALHPLTEFLFPVTEPTVALKCQKLKWRLAMSGFTSHGACTQLSLLMRVCSVMFDSLWYYGLQPTRLFCPWDFPGKNTGAGCHFLLVGIFPTQELNSHLLPLLQWQEDSLPGRHLGRPVTSCGSLVIPGRVLLSPSL